MAQVDATEFQGWTEELIKSILINRTDQNTIQLILFIKKDIQLALNSIIGDDFPDWYVESFNNIINSFLEIFKTAANKRGEEIREYSLDFKFAILYHGKKFGSFSLIYYSLPFLENYAISSKINNQFSKLESIDITTNELINNIKNNSKSEIDSLEERFNKFKTEADSILSLLNKQSGKIAVKEYAAIFEKQACEHSNLFIDNADTTKKKYRFSSFGKAQRWLAFAVIAFIILIISFTQLDKFFSLKDQYIFTPEVTVHIIGRFLFISLFIFIVSFSFKQFRVNMHLYTLNKHRANTLKSFEYLTHAPDKLDPISYNAILREVAKAIYESGQTGYINSSDNNADMPSIIDMSKVITQPRT